MTTRDNAEEVRQTAQYLHQMVMDEFLDPFIKSLKYKPNSLKGYFLYELRDRFFDNCAATCMQTEVVKALEPFIQAASAQIHGGFDHQIDAMLGKGSWIGYEMKEKLSPILVRCVHDALTEAFEKRPMKATFGQLMEKAEDLTINQIQDTVVGTRKDAASEAAKVATAINAELMEKLPAILQDGVKKACADELQEAREQHNRSQRRCPV